MVSTNVSMEIQYEKNCSTLLFPETFLAVLTRRCLRSFSVLVYINQSCDVVV